MTQPNPYRDLPQVDALADEIESPLPRALVVEAVRAALDQARRDIGEGLTVDAHAMARKIVRATERADELPVVNATGVLLHTNLGRSRWSARAIERATEAAKNQTSLEIDVDTGKRGRRGSYVTSLLRGLTGAEDALIVNNNASAVLLSLSALAKGSGVPVARGELIEIGGSYRLPEVMEASGATMVEVGTTNRTRVDDYRTAIQVHRCGAILKVHPSNYRVEGFTEKASDEDLAALARGHGIPLIHDIGSGLLDSQTPWLEGATPSWLRGEPAARQTLEAGSDVVTFSGDKLLGGPQAGIIVGTSDAVGALRSSALARALRVDGITYAALAATLEAFLNDNVSEIPFWRQATLSAEELEQRAAALAERVEGKVTEGHSTIGAGSTPGMAIPGPLVALEGEDHLYEALLAGDEPVVARRETGSLIIDLRTVDPDRDDAVAAAILKCR